MSKELDKKRGTEATAGPQIQLAQSAMFKSQLSSIRGSLEHDDTFEPTDHELLDHLHGVVHGGDTAAKALGEGESGYSDEEFEPDTERTLPSGEQSKQHPPPTTTTFAPAASTTSLHHSSIDDIRRRWLEEPQLLLSSLSGPPNVFREEEQKTEPEAPIP